jgi:carbon-monoxide dehydrogenase small subunit
VSVPAPIPKEDAVEISVRVNGLEHRHAVEPRKLLADFLREDLRLTGTHLGCEHGVCGACTVLLDGRAVRSCLLFAVQANGCEVTTVEGLANDAELHPVQQAFWDKHALQCGFCTPGFLMTTIGLLSERPDPTDEEIIDALSGNLCRCTGYVSIIEAVRAAVDRARQDAVEAQR